jgi:hypothetical protein
MIVHDLIDSALYTQYPHDTCPCVCSYVGWITQFIRQRHRAAASCAFSYSRLTFVRRMPPQIRLRLQRRQQKHNMNTSMRGFIAQYTTHTGRGSDVLFVKERNKRNSRLLTDVDRTQLQRSSLFTYPHYVMHSYLVKHCIICPFSALWVRLHTISALLYRLMCF